MHAYNFFVSGPSSPNVFCSTMFNKTQLTSRYSHENLRLNDISMMDNEHPLWTFVVHHADVV